MRKLYKTAFFVFFIGCVSLASCQQKPAHSVFLYSGRVEILQNDEAVLVGSASSVGFTFEGVRCDIVLKSNDSWEHDNYVSLELDGHYLGRLTVKKGEAKAYPVKVPRGKDSHKLVIYKATEAANGSVLFLGTNAKLTAPESKKISRKIEFIGNSITCGMGNETAAIPCGTGEWFDQHNAYLAYGPRIARNLKVDFLLSSVSGMGMYRNWNDENNEQPCMPEVYGNLYLNKDSSKPYDFAFHPDIISIALGTNDFSDGDGKKERLPFNPEKFISNYVAFVQMLYKNYPETQIVLVNSPMVNGTKDHVFTSCLEKIKAALDDDKNHIPAKIFLFQSITPHGCDYHPDAKDHQLMAEQYQPFLEKLLDKI